MPLQTLRRHRSRLADPAAARRRPCRPTVGGFSDAEKTCSKGLGTPLPNSVAVWSILSVAIAHDNEALWVGTGWHAGRVVGTYLAFRCMIL
jgi:hypothetical protein